MSVRAVYVAGALYAAASVVLIARGLSGSDAEHHHAPVLAQPQRISSAQAWFGSIKGRCNPVEVSVALADAPPPKSAEGTGYAAACLGLAGKIDQARALIARAPPEHRAYIASVVFYVAHPVADRGDDVAAGPMMELVLEQKPDDYMALYHAGMSQYALGRAREAERNLVRFRQLYTPNDFFGRNGDDAIDRIRRGLPPATQSPGAHD